MTRHTDSTTAYNTAYLTADRSHLVEAFDLDGAESSGHAAGDSGERTPPADYDRRRQAVLAFYGHRCGRCTRPIAASDPDAEAALGYVVSVGRLRDAVDPWALDELVALCPPCFDLVDASDERAIGGVATEFRAAPQFPSWHCDPRVAVERAPLTGKELFRRELLAERVSPRFDFRHNRAVAEHAALALPTSAARAVAMGVELLAGTTTAPGPDDCPERTWADAPLAVRAQYERRTVTPREIAASGRWTRAPVDEPCCGPDASRSAADVGSAADVVRSRPPSEG